MYLEECIKCKRRHEWDLFQKANVVGVGVGYKSISGRITDEPSIVVLVTKKIHPFHLDEDDIIRKDFEGIKTDVVTAGVIRAPPLLTPVGIQMEKHRPAPGGCSIGHYKITADTLGCLIRVGEEDFILSNNHILVWENRGYKGDPILQPAPADGGVNPYDKIAELETFVPISFTGTNRVDVAIAKPLDPTDVTDYIIGIGRPQGTIKAELGMPVVKSGRTTSVTAGTITIVDATVRVEYNVGSAIFENQLIVALPNFSKGGDSGSVVLDEETRKICGLLFAGSEYVTVINPIEDVFDAISRIV
jgi:hypothetical protein